MLALWIIVLIVCCVSTTQSQSNDLDADLKVAKAVVCAIVRHEESYIDEWLRYNQYLGFDAVHLYDNADEPSPYLASLSKVYGDFVKVQHFPGIQKQVAAYEECLHKFKTSNTWMAVIDADEFIVLRKHNTIKEFLHDHAPKGGAIALNWMPYSNNGAKKHEEGPILARFTYTTKTPSRFFKSISYPKHVEWVNIHNTEVLPGYPKVDVKGQPLPKGMGVREDISGNQEIAFVAHFHTKSLEEYTKKRHRGRADLVARGGEVSDTEILSEFEKYNGPHHEVEDTHARDFYLRQYLGVAFDAIRLGHISPPLPPTVPPTVPLAVPPPPVPVVPVVSGYTLRRR